MTDRDHIENCLRTFNAGYSHFIRQTPLWQLPGKAQNSPSLANLQPDVRSAAPLPPDKPFAFLPAHRCRKVQALS